ncbi:MAG: SDR family NAD(P)-dependent oxidoreductase [Planctomycetota bacterium]|jgi:NAD(P)-dependent dehydrogenase (short-subunit alcohol dehydrogenase family)
MRFQDKVAFVTGASSGIGRACGLRFQEEGAKVFAVARRGDRLKKDFEHFAVMDACDEKQVRAAVDACVKSLGRIDCLVNAAGIIGGDGVVEPKPDTWRRMMDVNLDGLYRVTRLVVPHLIKTRGSIVNVSSVCGMRPFAAVTSYCVSKAAVDMFTQCTALELAPHGVRVNSVNPGVVVTELHTVSKVVPDYSVFLEHSKTTHPLGRVGQPEEIAALCAFLCSVEAGWVTGGIHPIDGGRQLTCAR